MKFASIVLQTLSRQVNFIGVICLMLSGMAAASSESGAGVVTIGAPLADGAKICVVGDTGLANWGQYRVAAALQTEQCDQVRVVGDLIYQDGLISADDPQFLEKFWRPYQPLLAAKIPFYLLFGNHDHRGSQSAWFELARRSAQITFPSYYYAELWGDLCMISIDTMLLEQSTQREWLERVYAWLQPRCKLSIALGHHPLRSAGRHGNARGSRAKFLLEHIAGRVDLYIAGHDHQLSDEGQQQTTRLLISGAGASVRPNQLADRIPDYFAAKLGYLVIEIDRDSDQLAARYRFVEVEREAGLQSTAHQGVVLGRGVRPIADPTSRE